MVDQNLRLNEPALTWDPAQVTVPPAPVVPPGGDPMSVMLSAIAPQVAAAITQGVAEALAREEQFAANVHAARTEYQNTDGAAGRQIQGAGELGEPASAAAGVGSAQSAGSGAGDTGQLGQMMGMPMQMAQQAAQIPMQLAGMAASIPQGIMQGVQSAMQSVGQMGGTVGDKAGSGSDQAGDAPRDELRHVEAANEKPEERAPSAEGPSNAERAPAYEPQPTPAPEAPQQPHKPAPTRPATSGPESVL
ncbi:PE family protein [Mycobacterium sp. JS623]|uniref:PE domain-containing protein n=1 Tax=Mycobacterium sp. JS623 TaxID=212767 RepID=UPI0002A5A8B8|nr:PE domain-containing protein [Mycobacterium sp. JS623]AGB24011.1 PE family protein [Mycobacterium sp. JS623]